MKNNKSADTQTSPSAQDTRQTFPLKWRVLWAGIIMAGFLTAVPGFALTVDTGSSAQDMMPQRPYAKVADQGADACRTLLEESTAGAVPASATLDKNTAMAAPQRAAMPAAIVGYMLGARYATGPRESGIITVAAQDMPQNRQEIMEHKVRAIAAYRRCRAEHMLQALSQ